MTQGEHADTTERLQGTLVSQISQLPARRSETNFFLIVQGQYLPKLQALISVISRRYSEAFDSKPCRDLPIWDWNRILSMLFVDRIGSSGRNRDRAGRRLRKVGNRHQSRLQGWSSTSGSQCPNSIRRSVSSIPASFFSCAIYSN